MKPQASKELLRPAKTWFMLASMLLALIVNFIPLTGALWRPDILAVVILFWGVHQPKKSSFLFIFLFGLLMDTHYGVVLGQHALAYIVVCLIGMIGGRRIVWFDLPGQMFHLFPVLILFHVLLVLIYKMQGGIGFGWSVLWAPVLETLLWPVVYILLLIPQRAGAEKTGR